MTRELLYKIYKIKNMMRNHGYSFYNFNHDGNHYIASLSVKDNTTIFEITNGKGIIIHSEVI